MAKAAAAQIQTTGGKAGPRTGRPGPLLQFDNDLDFSAKNRQDQQQEEKMVEHPVPPVISRRTNSAGFSVLTPNGEPKVNWRVRISAIAHCRNVALRLRQPRT